MSWQDRDYADEERSGHGRPGGDWQGMRPTIDNPLTWSIDLARLGGVAIRMHLLFLLFIVVRILQAALGGTNLTAQTMAQAMGVLFVVVLAHELGHVLACRLMGGQADEILMWPLGGLAFCRPGARWSAHLVTALGGPIVNVVLCLVAGSMLGMLNNQWLGTAVPNPLHPFESVYAAQERGSWASLTLALINETSFVLLLFNLLPIFPLDGGRIVQAALWPKWGYTRSMLMAVRVGLIVAMVLGIYGAVMQQWMVVGIALFGGVTCYVTQKQLQWTDAALGLEADEYALSLHGGKDDDVPSRATRRERLAQRRALREQEEAREVDRILQKIADSGLPSLNRQEKALLKRVTERKRRER